MTTLDLAGWRVRLECRPTEFAALVAGQYAAFRVAADTPPDLTAQVTLAGTTESPALEETPRWNGHIWLLDALHFSGTIDTVRSAATLVFNSGEPLAHLDYFLRTLYALLAYQRGGLLIHAAGLQDPADGRVYLFTGQSGSGKSTVVALSPWAIALSDDLILLRPQGAHWTAYGTPFWNIETGRRTGQTCSGPVAGVYLLVQDSQVYLEALSPGRATAALAANCPILNADVERLPGLLQRCLAVAIATPVQRLHFRKDPGFWDLLIERAGPRAT